MKTTIPPYFCHQDTLYLEHTVGLEFETHIEETNQTLYSSQSCKQILEQTFIQTGTTLTGNTKALKKLFNLNQVPALPLHPHHDHYVFMTHSIRTTDCIFIFTAQLKTYTECKDAITFHFKNGKTKTVEMSKRKIIRIMGLLHSYHLYFKP